MNDNRVAARNVSMYPHQWNVVERVARNIAEVVGGRPNVSLGLRRIVEVYNAQERREGVARAVQAGQLDDDEADAALERLRLQCGGEGEEIAS